ncbi:sensor histidine kinase [Fodinisporobacter ferrooxydans]|uniref:histidine kinase n=1 Tax=Fodinisporobacter ferrooxydans TaxID=2901836 RepID=A0ABY4CTD8_9BACL|nr:sensor histidine kinase [Alicyclobacillaceae bacterium MYW30-H2]
MFRGMSIRWKITILSFGIILFSLMIGGINLIGNIFHVQEEELGKRLLVTARTIAELPPVIEKLSNEKNGPPINKVVERIRVINNVDYIVVLDMDGKILSHPVRDKIGTYSQGADERSAFAEHTYLSKAKGDLGIALRAFVPVMDEKNVQVGVVLVGKLLPSLWDVVDAMRDKIYVTFSLSLLFGILGSYSLAKHIKKQMLQLEPQEIARMLLERTATFNAIHEGIIAVDKQDRITIFNEHAMQMLKIHEDVVGRSIYEAIPDERLKETFAFEHVVYNQELLVGTNVILYTRVPIQLENQIIGAVLVFQDRTEVKKIAEELTGVRAFVDALRVQNHEFMNKLHTIGGLIQLNHKEKALDFLFQVTEQKEELTRFLSNRIGDESLAGLLIAKVSRGKELGIEVVIDQQSRLEHYPGVLDHHDFVILVGNLIENAFDALKDRMEHKKVFVSFEQDLDSLTVLVEDNGGGIREDIQSRIFEKGFSTKGTQGRGVGLHLVNSIVHKGKGDIQIDSREGEGTSIWITFPMKVADE